MMAMLVVLMLLLLLLLMVLVLVALLLMLVLMLDFLVVVDGTKTWILNRCAMMLVGNLIAP